MKGQLIMNALFIENVKDEFVPTFQELAKALNAKLSIASTDKQNFINAVKQDLNAYVKGELNCISMQECEKTMQDLAIAIKGREDRLNGDKGTPASEVFQRLGI